MYIDYVMPFIAVGPSHCESLGNVSIMRQIYVTVLFLPFCNHVQQYNAKSFSHCVLCIWLRRSIHSEFFYSL